MVSLEETLFIYFLLWSQSCIIVLVGVMVTMNGLKKKKRNIPSALTWGEYILLYVLCLNMSCSTTNKILKLSILLSFRQKHLVDFFA